MFNKFKNLVSKKESAELSRFKQDLVRVVAILSADNFSALKDFAIPRSLKRFKEDKINSDILVTLASWKNFDSFWSRFGFETNHDATVFQTMITEFDFNGSLEDYQELQIPELGEQNKIYRTQLTKVVKLLVANDFMMVKKFPVPKDFPLERLNKINPDILSHLAEWKLLSMFYKDFEFKNEEEAQIFEDFILHDEYLPFAEELILPSENAVEVVKKGVLDRVLANFKAKK